MIIRRAERPQTFTVIDNAIIEDRALTWEARGLLIFLLSKPDSWSINREWLVTQAPNGITAVRRCLAELEERLYLSRHRTNDPQTGRVVWESIVYDCPCAEKAQVRAIGAITTDGSATDGIPTGGERAVLVSTDAVSTEKAKPDLEPLYGFDQFWGVYPPRNGKRLERGKAEVQWRKMVLDDRRAAWRAAKNYARAVEAGLTIAKDAHRWLRDRCWADWMDGPGASDRAADASTQVIRYEEPTAQ